MMTRRALAIVLCLVALIALTAATVPVHDLAGDNGGGLDEPASRHAQSGLSVAT